MASSKNTSPANIFAVLGFALLLILAIWSAVQVVKYAPRLFDGSTTPTDIITGKPKVSLNMQQTQYTEDEEINLNWTISNIKDVGGIVSFVYECKDNLEFNVYDDLAKSYKKLPCSTPYNMPTDTKSLTIKPSALTVSETTSALAIVYINQQGEKFKDIVNVTIKKKGAATPVTPPTVTVPKPDNNKCASKLYGTPDLSILAVQTGYLAPNGYFVQKSTFAKGERIVLKFNVENKGDKTTPSWFFNLNVAGITSYVSQTQPPIPPCGGRAYTVTIDNPSVVDGSKLVEVILDSANLIREKTEYNNRANTTITVY